MEDISDVYITDFIPSIYNKPVHCEFNQNGKAKSVDLFLNINSVTIIVYNKTKDVLVLVKQFRPPLYFQNIPESERHNICGRRHPAKLGISLEFCGGIDDKNVPAEKLAQEEILEECGYQVPLESLEKIFTFVVETNGARTTFFYCEVTEDQRVSTGGGSAEEHEIVHVIEMKVEDVVKYVNQDHVYSPAAFMFLVNWFLYHKYNK